VTREFLGGSDQFAPALVPHATREVSDLAPRLFEVPGHNAALRLLNALRAGSQRFSHSRYTIGNLALLLIEHRLGGRSCCVDKFCDYVPALT
jgi:hypothetical protein